MNTGDPGYQLLSGNRRIAVLAALPSLIFGSGIALSAIIIQEQHNQMVSWRLILGLSIFILFTAVIMLGGVLAIHKRLPVWGYSWSGAALMSIIIAVKTLAEERADLGLSLITPTTDIVLAVFLLVSALVLIFFAASHGWQAAGLVSIGFAAIFTLSVIAAVTATPFRRNDIAILAAPVGVLIAAVTYMYVIKDDLHRIILLVSLGIVNASSVWLVDRVWMAGVVRPSAFWPFFIAGSLALLAGPLSGVILGLIYKIFRLDNHSRNSII